MIAPTIVIFVVITLISINAENSYPCNALTTKNGIVCVCDSDYCDKVPALSSFETAEQYQLYHTSNDSPGFQTTLGKFTETKDASEVEILVDITVPVANGSVLGFGGAFTDSAGFNILALPESAQNKLLESYFGDDGIEYSFGRIPMGGTDFSLRHYSYDDKEDPALANFTLQPEDFNYKISFINKAKEFRNGKGLKLLASVWTAPPWMKTNKDWTTLGYLKEEHYQTWVDYFIKFFEAYDAEGIEFWGMTTQNEPLTGFLPMIDFPAMAWTPEQLNNWIGTNLGPTLRNSRFSKVKILAHDDQRLLLPLLHASILSNDTVLQYLDGVAVHFYGDEIIPKEVLNFGHTEKKDLFILSTEACTGNFYVLGIEAAVVLGSWERAETYLRSIFDDLSVGVAGWIDWNIALDTQGGPLFIHNNVDSPVIVNASAGEFYKQPMFYALGHFSKFVSPGSIIVKTEVNDTGNGKIMVLAFLRPDSIVAVIIWNENENDVTVSIKNLGIPNSIRTLLNIRAKSINSFLYSAQ